MGIKKVTRTYKTKSGKLVTKTYTYGGDKYKYKHKSTKGKVLVNSRGVINKKNIEKLKEEIMNDPNLTNAEKRAALKDIDVYVFTRHQNKQKLTTTGFAGIEANDDITRMFANAGYTVEDAADLIGVDPDELLDEDNWVDGDFIYNGHTYRFNFNYTGDIWTEI